MPISNILTIAHSDIFGLNIFSFSLPRSFALFDPTYYYFLFFSTRNFIETDTTYWRQGIGTGRMVGHLGKLYKILSELLIVYLVFGQIFNLLWQFLQILGNFEQL